MADRICARCGKLRTENSFYTDQPKRADICKSCIHNPDRLGRVKPRARLKTREHRTEIAVRHVVKKAQGGQEFVYLAATSRRFKIGRSVDVSKRMKQLDTGSSELIRLIAVAPGGRQLEQELHKKFGAWRERLEWFRRKPTIVQTFIELPGSMVFLPGIVSQDPPPDVIR